MKLNRKLAALAGALLAIGYFVVIPAIQVSDYKKSASSHRAVDDKMALVYANFKRDAFTKTDTKAANDKADIDAGRAAVKDAESALGANSKSMTKFHALPLLFWNKKYKAATDTDASETAYIQKSRTFLDNYTAMLNYSQAENALNQKVDAIDTDANSVQKASTPAAAATQIDTLVSEFQPLIDADSNITPPVFMRASHTAELTSITDITATLKSMSTAIRSLDLIKITTLAADLDKSVSDYTKQQIQFITQLHQESVLAVEMLELRSLNTKISKGYASL